MPNDSRGTITGQCRGAEVGPFGLELRRRALRLLASLLVWVAYGINILPGAWPANRGAATLEALALDRALQRLCTEFSDSAGIPVQLSVISPVKRIASNPPKIEKQKRKECA
jgi:hypothetical protein